MKRVFTFLFLSAVMQTFFVRGMETQDQAFYLIGDKDCKIQLSGELIKHCHGIEGSGKGFKFEIDGINQNVLNDVVSLLAKIYWNEVNKVNSKDAQKVLQKKSFEHIEKCLQVADLLKAPSLFDSVS